MNKLSAVFSTLLIVSTSTFVTPTKVLAKGLDLCPEFPVGKTGRYLAGNKDLKPSKNPDEYIETILGMIKKIPNGADDDLFKLNNLLTWVEDYMDTATKSVDQEDTIQSLGALLKISQNSQQQPKELQLDAQELQQIQQSQEKISNYFVIKKLRDSKDSKNELANAVNPKVIALLDQEQIWINKVLNESNPFILDCMTKIPLDIEFLFRQEEELKPFSRFLIDTSIKDPALCKGFLPCIILENFKQKKQIEPSFFKLVKQAQILLDESKAPNNSIKNKNLGVLEEYLKIIDAIESSPSIYLLKQES